MMNLFFDENPLYISRFNYKLGGLRRDLSQLAHENLLAGSADILREVGYQFSFGLAPDETLLSLAASPFGEALHQCEPSAALFQHCYAESAVLPWSPEERDVGARNRYFGGTLMKELGVAELPYFCSFASGCAGFVFLSIAAGGLLSSSEEEEVICVMGDSMPPQVTYDLAKERILGSAVASAFVIGRTPAGYQLLASAVYSSTRALVPLLELVKRTVDMINGLARRLKLDLSRDIRIHYPNMFPEAWKMVTRYLRLSEQQHIMLGLAERAHCFGSDSVMSLAEAHSQNDGAIHFVVNYGLGLHLGICALREVGVAR